MILWMVQWVFPNADVQYTDVRCVLLYELVCVHCVAFDQGR